MVCCDWATSAVGESPVAEQLSGSSMNHQVHKLENRGLTLRVAPSNTEHEDEEEFK